MNKEKRKSVASSVSGMPFDQDAALKAHNDNKANHCNPNNALYRGYTSGYHGKGTKADLDNHAKQLNKPHSSSHGNRAK